MYKLIDTCELQTSVGTDDEGESVFEEVTYTENDTFDEDNIVSENDNVFEVQWANGNVTYIPKEFVVEI